LTSVSTSVMLKRVFINRCNAILGNALGFSVDDEGHRCPTRNNYLIWAATAPNRELMYYSNGISEFASDSTEAQWAIATCF
jgi:hypothetical protein